MKLFLLAAATLACGLLAGAAVAGPAAAVRQACAADMQTLCPDAKPGLFGGGLRACMRSHFSDLSDGCKQAIMAMRSHHQKASSH